MTQGMRPAVVAEIGERIRAARHEQGLSVAALAETSDVSRRMLTQIELGQANPSVSVLDRVAAGLGTTFAAVMGLPTDAPDGVEVWSTEGGSWAYLLTALGTEGTSVEMWKWHLAATDAYTSEDAVPSAGVMHHVLDGVLEIETAAGTRRIAAGASDRSTANLDYTYRAAGGGPVSFVSVALQPGGTPS